MGDGKFIIIYAMTHVNGKKNSIDFLLLVFFRCY